MALSNPKLLLQTRFPLLSSMIPALFVMLLLANKVHSQDHVDFQIDTFPPNPATLTYQVDAHVPSGSTFLQLVGTDSSGNPTGDSVGRVVYNTPVQFWDDEGRQADFETTITFITRPSQNGEADGITFFIAPANSTLDDQASGGSLGIFGSPGPIFAVEFDTYVNADIDPDYPHIGIDINSQTSSNVTNFESSIGQEVTARIDYDPNTGLISVHATAGSQTYDVSYVFDLRTLLPQQVQVGLSASTGPDTDIDGVHDIYSWYFTSTLVDDQNNIENNGAHLRQYV